MLSRKGDSRPGHAHLLGTRWRMSICGLKAGTQTSRTVWPSGPRRWLQAPVRKGVGSNPATVISPAGLLASVARRATQRRQLRTQQPAWLTRQSARLLTLWSWVRAPRWVRSTQAAACCSLTSAHAWHVTVAKARTPANKQGMRTNTQARCDLQPQVEARHRAASTARCTETQRATPRFATCVRRPARRSASPQARKPCC